MELNLSEDLVYRNLDVKSDGEILEFLAKELVEKNYVDESYVHAIHEREKTYPTGLPSTDPGIAIPHASYDMVKKTTMAIATLKNPVEFTNMGDKKEKLSVQIVIMMAIRKPQGQIEMLQRVLKMIEDEPLRRQMLDASTDAELLELFKKVVY